MTLQCGSERSDLLIGKCRRQQKDGEENHGCQQPLKDNLATEVDDLLYLEGYQVHLPGCSSTEYKIVDANYNFEVELKFPNATFMSR